MDPSEALDREVIIERAEEIRGWLAGMGLSSRASGALERELSGIIANDPGGYINGQRPLAGVTVAEFAAALHSRGGGVVGQVKSVGEAILTELRAAIPVGGPALVAAPEAPEPALVAAPEAPEPALAAAPEAPEPTSEADPPKRKPGRPKGSTKAARNGTAAAQPSAKAEPPAEAAPASEPVQPESGAEVAPPKRGRGRPRKSDTPAPAVAAQPRARIAPAPSPTPAPQPPAQATTARPDPALDQLVRLWPTLHPHARRAVVLYASALLAENDLALPA